MGQHFLFPPRILFKRIESNFRIFYDDLGTYCRRMDWRFDVPQCSSDEVRFYHQWQNNLVEVELFEQYSDNRAKAFLFTYHIPSPVGNPKNKGRANLTDNPPEVGYKHQIYVAIPMNYPSVRAVESSGQRSDITYIESRSQLWHPRFYLQQKSWGCIMVNGELDRIAMNLFQQLLWEPGHVWKLPGEHETTNNRAASQWGKEMGHNEIHQFMIRLMTERWGEAT